MDHRVVVGKRGGVVANHRCCALTERTIWQTISLWTVVVATRTHYILQPISVFSPRLLVTDLIFRRYNSVNGTHSTVLREVIKIHTQEFPASRKLAPFQEFSVLIFLSLLSYRQSTLVICGYVVERWFNTDPPNKYLHRDTFLYSNKQSARLISTLSHYILHAIAWFSSLLYRLHNIVYIAKALNQIRI